MRSAKKPVTVAELQQAVDDIPFWYHSIDLGHGVVTEGDKSPDYLNWELAAIRLPDLAAKTVLDIGAWDGYYSWTAERLGARRVVSLDHFVWALDREQARAIAQRWREEGSRPQPFETTDAWKPDTLPGKRGYDLAHQVLDSRAESYVADFTQVNYEAELDGPFDVVLWLGVLYHMRHPLLALQKVAEATQELAIIESEAVVWPGFEQYALCEFFERDELASDFTNWWSPSEKALVGMIRAAGFRQVEVLQGQPENARRPRWPWTRSVQPSRYRTIVHAWK